MPGINLDSIKADAALEDEGTLLHVKDKHDEPAYYGPPETRKPVTILVAGSLSKTFRAAEQAFNRMVGKRAQRGAGITQFLDRRAVEVAAGCCLAWDGFFYDPEETRPFPLAHEHAVAVLESAPYILAQVMEAMGDHAGFTKSGSETS